MVKLVKQSMKIRLASPGSMARDERPLQQPEDSEERMPSWLARRQEDSGMLSMLSRMRRAASGMLKKTVGQQDAGTGRYR